MTRRPRSPAPHAQRPLQGLWVICVPAWHLGREGAVETGGNGGGERDKCLEGRPPALAAF